MNRLLKNTIFGLITLVLLASCNEDDVTDQWLSDNPNTTPATSGDNGDVDLSNLVVLGTSLASGVQDGALYDAGQGKSFPALLGAQFQINGIGGTAFSQPDIDSEFGFHLIINNATTAMAGLTLGRSILDISDAAPTVENNGDAIGLWTGSAGSLNNFSAPLLQAGQLVITETGGSAGTSDPRYSGLYARFASSPGTSTMLSDAISAQPTFFVYEAGLNDVLLYALGLAPITDNSTFGVVTGGAILGLASGGSHGTMAASYDIEGVVLNIPNPLLFPYFRAVPYNALPISSDAAGLLNSNYAAYNAGLGQALLGSAITQEEHDRRLIQFSASEGHPFIIEDETLTDLSGSGLPSIRLSEATDLVLLPAAAEFADGLGTSTAAGDEFILLPSEQLEINQAVTDFNASLDNTVQTLNGLVEDDPIVVVVDIASIYNDVSGLDGEVGIRYQGLLLSPDFLPNGMYSTDGIHPCQRGHGIIANEIVNEINEQWGADIPRIEIAPLLGAPFRP